MSNYQYQPDKESVKKLPKYKPVQQEPYELTQKDVNRVVGKMLTELLKDAEQHYMPQEYLNKIKTMIKANK